MPAARVEHAVLRATPAVVPVVGFRAGLGALYPLLSLPPNRSLVKHAAWLATPSAPWSTQSCVPHRQSCRWSAS